MDAIAVVGLAACASSEDQVVGDRDGQEELNAAIHEARATLPRFFVELKGGEGDFLLKVPVRSGREVEQVWISDLHYVGCKFTGRITSKADSERGAGVDQSYPVTGGDISDWMIERDGEIYGGYTLRARLRELN